MCGATENAGLENDGPSKNRGGGGKMQEWKLADQIARLENARLENAGPENAGPENAGLNVFYFLPLSYVYCTGI